MSAAYADPLMRQKWNMYVSFGIQQFLSLNDDVSHRAQETADGHNYVWRGTIGTISKIKHLLRPASFVSWEL